MADILMPEAPGATARPTPSDAARNAYVQLLERIISRMGQTHFATKAWSIALVGAVTSFARTDTDSRRGLWPLIGAVVLFWLLDAKYFRHEQLFRRLFQAAATDAVPPFDTSTKAYEAQCPYWRGAFGSLAVWPVHVTAIVAVVLKAWLGPVLIGLAKRRGW